MLVDRMGHLLGYDVEHILLYQDMTARDLLQQRTTTPNGDTVWTNSALVSAALEGKMTVLDGVHRLHRGTMTVLHRLLHDRELQLYDGTRLVREDRFEALRKVISQQAWSLTQFYSVDFSRSRIGVKKWVFNKCTIKVHVSCF